MICEGSWDGRQQHVQTLDYTLTNLAHPRAPVVPVRNILTQEAGKHTGVLRTNGHHLRVCTVVCRQIRMGECDLVVGIQKVG